MWSFIISAVVYQLPTDALWTNKPHISWLQSGIPWVAATPSLRGWVILIEWCHQGEGDKRSGSPFRQRKTAQITLPQLLSPAPDFLLPGLGLGSITACLRDRGAVPGAGLLFGSELWPGVILALKWAEIQELQVSKELWGHLCWEDQSRGCSACD